MAGWAGSESGIDRDAAERSFRHVSDSLLTAPIPEGSSPYLTDGRTLSGETGKPIPCQCVFKGTTFQLGESVCMNTWAGTVLTRCELLLNNTSWKPTDTPCTISRAPSHSPFDVAAADH